MADSEFYMGVTRLAPSPTGALHFGNARTFILNWVMARQNNWQILLRIEDLDGPRVKQLADRELMDDLRWLGLTWDQGPIYQSHRLALYSRAIESLERLGVIYPCTCTRREVEQAASAPHGPSGAIYPGVCRGKYTSRQSARQQSGREPAMRFAVPPGIVRFVDTLRGTCEFDVENQFGDFVIQKADLTPAYHLAVVVDDCEMGVTHVIRGDDLLDSAARQVLLYRALGWGSKIPTYTHLPLVVGPDGLRLAKRHGDTRLASFRQAGVRAGRVIGLIARWSGVLLAPEEMSLDELVKSFRIENLPRTPIIFTEADHRWLLDEA